MSDPAHSKRLPAVPPPPVEEDEEDLVLFLRAGRLPRQPIRDFALVLRSELTQGRPFHCLITDDRELHRLNKAFLGKDYPADVLSFPAGSQSPGLLGELAISSLRAMSQALEFGHPALAEIQILMLHGVLHLLGMDHETDSGEMARAESLWRKKLGLPDSLLERAGMAGARA